MSMDASTDAQRTDEQVEAQGQDSGGAPAEVERAKPHLDAPTGTDVKADSTQELATTLVKAFTQRTITVATAESLTGGLLGATLTSVPGSSAAYMGGVVAYATPIKVDVLGVDAESVDDFTVVSEQVAREMAFGVQRLSGAEWGLSCTGVAGPEAQDGHEPGDVWIACVGPSIGVEDQPVYVEHLELSGDREAIREQTVRACLQMILRVVAPV